MKKGGILNTPADFDVPASGHPKGSPGVYDGEPGMTPGRTKSSNALPEKTYDKPPGADAGR